MGRSGVDPLRLEATPGRALFLVEGYRPASSVDLRQVVAGGHGVIGVIEIPTDETVLVLVAVPDAATAEQAVLDRGVTPIRVVGVRWEGPYP